MYVVLIVDVLCIKEIKALQEYEQNGNSGSNIKKQKIIGCEEDRVKLYFVYSY